MDMDRAADAGLVQRIGALALDGVLVLAVFAAMNVVLYKCGILGAAAGGEVASPLTLWAQPPFVLALTLALCAGAGLCWRFFAGTPGARVMGLMLVRGRDGERVGSLRVLTRLLMVLALAGLGVLWSVRGRCALHDRFSGTRLVVEDERLVHMSRLADAAS